MDDGAAPHGSLPPYPPARVWSFPPPPVKRRWFWIALSTSLLATVAAIGLVTAAVVFGSRDSRGMIDDPQVLDTIERQCRQMTATVESLPPGTSARDRAAVVRDQNAAVLVMVDRIADLPASTLRDDDPVTAWLDDWRALVQAREQFADDLLRDPSASLRIPRGADDARIVQRMEDAQLEPVCAVPEVLVDPDSARSSSI